MIQKPRGTQDIFAQEAKEWNALETKLKNILARFNFSEIRTPIFEAKELFVRSVGETSDVVSKEMYDLIDKKGREFVLRPEGTAPTVRALIENKLYAPEFLPLKAFYIGPMFRYERPQIGRNRQFHQLGVEVFGPNSFNQDIEVAALAYQLVKEIGLADKVKIDINFLVTGEGRVRYIEDLKKYLTNFDLCNDCKVRIEKNTLRVLDCKIDGDKFTDAPNMNLYLSEQEEVEFKALIKGLEAIGIKTELNTKLVRGLDYYTGFIFELKYLENDLGSQQTLIAGGRYNNLVEDLNGPSTPAAGFAMGMERIIITLKENGITLVEDDSIDVYTIALSTNAMILNQKIISDLRNNGFKVDTDYMNRSMKSAFKQAEKFKAKNIIILGDQEFESNNIKIKNQITGTTTEVEVQNLVETLKGE
ncbi:histidine--tRNA ligase [[Acholeplasma] multilocale]|uniref:histidine--tRNA ligase n=1 Tax=[Acholeplasma] multilocale TaxID=264638 RepID=UPI00047DD522|nr:histidine--tRNA ligase [[Acholeplasma] multilocale]